MFAVVFIFVVTDYCLLKFIKFTFSISYLAKKLLIIHKCIVCDMCFILLFVYESNKLTVTLTLIFEHSWYYIKCAMELHSIVSSLDFLHYNKHLFLIFIEM